MYQQPHLFRLGIVALLTFCVHPLFGGVVLDGSFGKSGALPGPNFMIQANFGKQVGGNLFQSFNQFNVNSTESATFSGPSTIHNILARVTSGSASSIDGAINSSIQGANLFFLNPAGVVFGQHAQINVSGSFAVSTANYLKLADGGRFNTSLGGGDVLTSAPVSAFGFLNSAPGSVSIAGAVDVSGNRVPDLTVAAARSFSIIAGDIAMSGGQINGEGSRVNLVSVKSPGEVALDATNINSTVDVAQFTALGTIKLTNFAFVDTSGAAGGPVVIRAENLTLDGSGIRSDTFGPTQGGRIDIDIGGRMEITNRGFIAADTQGNGNAGSVAVRATDLRITDGGSVSTDTFGIGKGGDVTVTAGSFLLDGSSSSGILSAINAGTAGDGNAGNVTICATDLRMTNSSTISTSTFGVANGGNVTVIAGSFLIDASGIEAITEGAGTAGSVAVRADRLRIADGGSIHTSSLFGQGKGGDVMVTAGSLVIDGVFSGIFADTESGNGNAGSIAVRATDLRITDDGAISAESSATFQPNSGDAGSISVQATNLSITDGGYISSATSSDGNGGDVTVTATSLLVNAGESFHFHQTGIFADTTGAGNAGSVTVRANDFRITGGGQISTNTGEFLTGELGKAGDVTVIADSLLIDGPDSGIFADTVTGGAAGNIALRVTDLRITNFGGIATSTSGKGNGGNVNVTADSLLIDGEAFIAAGTRGNEVTGGANAGSVTVRATELRITGGGAISTSTFGTGNGGNVNVTADSLFIDGAPGPLFLRSGIFAEASEGSSGTAGSVAVQATDLTITGGGEISSSTFGDGNGGTVNVTAESLSIDGSTNGFQKIPVAFTGIAATSQAGAKGDAGTVTINVDHALSILGGGQISTSTFSSGDAGNVDIHAGSISMNSLADIANNATGIFSRSEKSATGNAGDVTLTVNGALNIVAGSFISTAAFNSGKGGDITIQAGSLLIDNSLTDGSPTTLPTLIKNKPVDLLTGVSAAASGGGKDPTGNAGNIKLTVDGALTMLGHGQIFDGSLRTSTGDGGTLTIRAGSLSIDDTGTDVTGIDATGMPVISPLRRVDISAETRGSGNAGNMNITVDGALSIVGSGEIGVSTVSFRSDTPVDRTHPVTGITSGNAGTLTIHAGSLLIDGSATPGPDGFTGIAAFTQTDGADSLTKTIDKSGNAGSLNITVGGDVKMKGGSIASSSTLKPGSVAPRSATFGAAGSVTLVSDGTIRLVDNSSVSVFGLLNAGDIMIKAPVLVNLIDSDINATAGSIGGNITIDPIALRLRNSTISASAGAQGGHIDLFTSFLVGPVKAVTPGVTLLAFNSSITATGGTSNGTVNVTAPELDLGAELITLPISLLSAENQLQERCTALLQGDFSSFISIGRGGTEPAPEELQTTF
jgi:filamentous hemagglutinin family protein